VDSRRLAGQVYLALVSTIDLLWGVPADVGPGCLAELVEKHIVTLQVWTEAFEPDHQV
jgi:hypothetical protein